ncbi:MAG: hypothetical protein OEY88_11130, partial [Candidatus Bathyarchaeota archaeon]|nr:hypothetical protein [Candidatus Bathyarchaeota archaeon]
FRIHISIIVSYGTFLPIPLMSVDVYQTEYTVCNRPLEANNWSFLSRWSINCACWLVGLKFNSFLPKPKILLRWKTMNTS